MAKERAGAVGVTLVAAKITVVLLAATGHVAPTSRVAADSEGVIVAATAGLVIVKSVMFLVFAFSIICCALFGLVV